MTPTIHLISVEPPGRGGVGDYTVQLADALRHRDVPCRVWNAADPQIRRALPRALESEPGWILLQYVPHALGRRGANLGFCLWMLSLRRRGHDVRVMFHEPYFYFGWRRPWRNALAVAQRVMAAVLLRAATVSYLSTSRWIEYLRPLAPRGTRFVELPIPATVHAPAAREREQVWRRRFVLPGTAFVVGHFGSYGEHVIGELRPLIGELLKRRPDVTVACMGRGSDRFASEIAASWPSAAGRVIATGTLGAAETAAALRACDVLVQPYPDGVTTRRTTVMAALASGVATVTSVGSLTEDVWVTSGAVSLAPAGDASAHAGAITALLDDAAARGRLSTRAQTAYEAYFSMTRTVETLLADPEAVAR